MTAEQEIAPATTAHATPWPEEAAAVERAAAEAKASREAALAPVEALSSELKLMALPDGYEPRVDDVRDLLLPKTRALLDDIHRLDLQYLGELLRENPPWSFHDPCLRAFGGDGSGDVYALHVYPPTLARGESAPVVHWDHEQHAHRFLAPSLERFVAMLLHEVLADELDGDERRREAEAVSKRLGIEPAPPTGAWSRWEVDPELSWPLPRETAGPPAALPPEPAEERELARALTECLIEESAIPVSETFRLLDELYRELGWPAHRRCLHYQAHDWIDHRRQWALWQLTRGAPA